MNLWSYAQAVDSLEILRSQPLEFYVLALGCFITGYWLMPDRFQRIYTSLGFSAAIIVMDWVSFCLLLAIAIIIYAMARMQTKSLPMLLAGLALLFTSFIVHETARVFTFGTSIYDLVFMTGMAFYSLRLIHYWWESQKQTLPPHNFWAFYSYIFFLPIFIVGPILRFEEFMLWDRQKRWDWNNMFSGVFRISVGLFKIVVLSGYGVNDIMHNWGLRVATENRFLEFYIPCIEYGLNIYLQFSGYSHIAIGFGLLLGYRICENFNFPFVRTNIVEFWKCWHMSLTNWVRHYIYMPILTYTQSARLGIFISMSMIGVWHGFTINALLWGIYHGIGINLYHIYKKSAFRQKMVVENVFLQRVWYITSIFLTFNYVMLANYLLK